MLQSAASAVQAEERCHRPGQTRPGLARVPIHYLLSSHTLDEQMYELIDQKWAAHRPDSSLAASTSAAEAVPGPAAC